jgi:hypothetical protein
MNHLTLRFSCSIGQTMALQLFVKQEVALSPMATLVQKALRQASINLGVYNEVSIRRARLFASVWFLL